MQLGIRSKTPPKWTLILSHGLNLVTYLPASLTFVFQIKVDRRRIHYFPHYSREREIERESPPPKKKLTNRPLKRLKGGKEGGVSSVGRKGEGHDRNESEKGSGAEREGRGWDRKEATSGWGRRAIHHGKLKRGRREWGSVLVRVSEGSL